MTSQFDAELDRRIKAAEIEIRIQMQQVFETLEQTRLVVNELAYALGAFSAKERVGDTLDRFKKMQENMRRILNEGDRMESRESEHGRSNRPAPEESSGAVQDDRQLSEEDR